VEAGDGELDGRGLGAGIGRHLCFGAAAVAAELIVGAEHGKPILELLTQGAAMAVETITVSLRAWHPEGKRVPRAAFMQKLVIARGDPVKKDTGPGDPCVDLVSLAAEDFAKEEEPSEAFAAALGQGLNDAAKWLAKQSPAVFEALREAGFDTDIFIGAWIDLDQMDLDLPPEFLLQCGRLGLLVSIITND
jgi:hypothetical protein